MGTCYSQGYEYTACYRPKRIKLSRPYSIKDHDKGIHLLDQGMNKCKVCHHNLSHTDKYVQSVLSRSEARVFAIYHGFNYDPYAQSHHIIRPTMNWCSGRSYICVVCGKKMCFDQKNQPQFCPLSVHNCKDSYVLKKVRTDEICCHTPKGNDEVDLYVQNRGFNQIQQHQH